jgi:ferredoxin
MFFAIDDGKYLLKIVTDKGREALKDIDALTSATDGDVRGKDRLIAATKESMRVSEMQLDAGELEKKLDDFDASFWQTIHIKCLGCGVCTYFCPTCHCFDLTDETKTTPYVSSASSTDNKAQGRRIRTWDSCMFPLFTRHASGHNPRPTLKERMRQRIMHKFNYTVKNYSEIFCVGCGRCVVNCPVNLDIRNVLKEICDTEAQ